MSLLDLPENAGRQYGYLNGDLNPIHLWPWSARLFGFKRPIAHALYLMALSLSKLQSTIHRPSSRQSPGAQSERYSPKRIEAEFKRPTILPSQLVLMKQNSKEEEDGDTHFCLTTSDRLKHVLIGAVAWTTCLTECD